MGILQLKPSFKYYLWGGRRLIEEYHKTYNGDILAETWELSCNPDMPSYIVNGAYAGKTLQQYIDIEGKSVLGCCCSQMAQFPILTKFIDACQDLAIQVHPDDSYGMAHEGQLGKTEMWYIMEADEGAYVYYGFKRKISKEEFRQRIEDETLTEVLNTIPVHKGDVFFVESGTIHAIGKNILVAEIQQNSDITYRVYDFGRVEKDGTKRTMHVQQALDVTKLEHEPLKNNFGPHLVDCNYFTVDKLSLDGIVSNKEEGYVSRESFVSILIMDGEGIISDSGGQLPFKKGDSFFIPAGSGAYSIEGRCDALITYIKDRT